MLLLFKPAPKSHECSRRSSQGSLLGRGALASLLVLAVAAFSFAVVKADSITHQAKPDITPLEPGKPIERELGGEEVHSYSFALAAGQ